eukprot:COSAG02_NODE_786_length_17199_cov_25.278889_16_plen_114_part_00
MKYISSPGSLRVMIVLPRGKAFSLQHRNISCEPTRLDSCALQGTLGSTIYATHRHHCASWVQCCRAIEERNLREDAVLAVIIIPVERATSQPADLSACPSTTDGAAAWSWRIM